MKDKKGDKLPIRPVVTPIDAAPLIAEIKSLSKALDEKLRLLDTKVKAMRHHQEKRKAESQRLQCEVDEVQGDLFTGG